MMDFSDILNTGNLSPMSPTPVGDFSYTSNINPGAIPQDPVDVNRTIQAFRRSNIIHANDEAYLNQHVLDNRLQSQQKIGLVQVLDNRLQSQQKIGLVSMDTPRWVMPMKAGSYHEVDNAIADPINAFQVKDNQVNGAPNGHMHYCGNGQTCDAMGTKMDKKSILCADRSTNNRIQWTGNDLHLPAPLYGKIPISMKYFPNNPHQQKTTQSDISSKGNSYNSTSSGGAADGRNSCQNFMGWHSSKIICSQQGHQKQDQIFEKQQPYLQLYQQPHLQPYQKEQKNNPKQHQQRWKSCQQQNSYSQLGNQHLQNHQQQSLLNNNGIKPAHTSKMLWGKHTSHLSNQESLHQEYQTLLQPQTKEMVQPGNLPTAVESQGQWLGQNTQKHWFHLQHNQNLQPLLPEGQLQIQSQNVSVGFPSKVQPKDGLQVQQESKPQEKNLFLHRCLEKQKEVDKHVINTVQMNRHQLSWPQLPPNDEFIATLNTKNIDSISTGDIEVSGQSSDVNEEQKNEYFKGKNELIGNATQCMVVEDKCQTVNYSPQKLLSAEMIKFPTQCFPLTTDSLQQGSCDNCCPVYSPDCQSFPQECNNSLNHSVINSKDETTCHVGTHSQCVTNLNFEDQTKVFVNEEKIQEPPLKKSKLEHASSSDVKKHVGTGQKPVPSLNKVQLMFEWKPNGGKANDSIPFNQNDEVFKSSKQTGTTAITDMVENLWESIPEKHAIYKNVGEAKDAQEEREFSQAASEFNSIASSRHPPFHRQEENQVKLKAPRMTSSADSSFTTKLVKSKLKGISLTEFFTPEQIRDHVAGLQQLIFQDKGNTEYNPFTERQVDENSCQLCTAGELKFQPPPIYCTSCGARIKRNAMYYTAGVGVTRNYFCMACYDKMQDCVIGLDGVTYLKSKLDKRKNSDEIEEGWVQCCKCKLRQHQICALFNARRIENDHADYICPSCYIKEINRGERKPLLQSAVLGARDLPKTYLSDHIEQRLSQRLKQERKERATLMGKSYEEVPGAEALVVRVVSSVDKKVEVKQNFLEIVRDEGYPSEFPYKSKKINGVDVCLFSVYVQEFGSECSHPNQRRISLSYLDSVKYFRPDVTAVTGESLRTFVYHEILIGYLDYCKRRGFTSCYIWACPPIKGEDYILYCHPQTQKVPKCDKLREWYHRMLSKATEEKIVLDLTNFYDYFFTSADECKARVTITRLPYFDGDYWPGAIEDMILQLQVGDENFKKQQKKLKSKRNTTDLISHGAPQAGLPDSFSKDALLMQKLHESALAMKDDFIMVHMHHSCSHCRLFILSGKRWVCNQCINFQLCDKCYETEEKLDGWDRHPTNSKEKHVLVPNDVTDIPTDTEDKDEIMESEFFDTRQAFLSLCQGNHYQYDTLRRAEHSSMMILYHLHNPAAPAFASTCNVCERDIETGQGWRCDTCVDFDICHSCYHDDKFLGHPHKLIAHPSIIEYNAQNREARQRRIVQLRKMLDLMVHASRCYSSQCQYPNCRKVKGLFRHGTQCKTRASGGCPHCKKMWYLIQLHGRACKESKCRVPHCKDLKEHFRRLQQQMESRRRAAVMEMMRQRAEDASSKCS